MGLVETLFQIPLIGDPLLTLNLLSLSPVSKIKDHAVLAGHSVVPLLLKVLCASLVLKIVLPGLVLLNNNWLIVVIKITLLLDLIMIWLVTVVGLITLFTTFKSLDTLMDMITIHMFLDKPKKLVPASLTHPTL